MDYLLKAPYLFAALFFCSVLSALDFHTFVNEYGRTLEARLLSFNADKSLVDLEMRDGRKIKASKLSAFSKKDQNPISFDKEYAVGVY